MPVSSKEFLDIQANIECRFTLKRVHDMIRTYSQLIDYVLKSSVRNVIVSGMHLIGQILNCNDRREYQGRWTQYFHIPILVENVLKVDEDDGEMVTKFIDIYISCSPPNASQ